VDGDVYNSTPMSWIEVEHPSEIVPPNQLNGIVRATDMNINIPEVSVTPAQGERPPSTVRSLSEYDPYVSVPAAAIYSQNIPIIQRGRQAPFPSKPLLPTSMIPRIRATNYQEVARYKDLTVDCRAFASTARTLQPEATPTQLTENSRGVYEGNHMRYTTLSTNDSVVERVPILTEEKSHELRQGFQYAVEKMIRDDETFIG